MGHESSIGHFSGRSHSYVHAPRRMIQPTKLSALTRKTPTRIQGSQLDARERARQRLLAGNLTSIGPHGERIMAFFDRDLLMVTPFENEQWLSDVNMGYGGAA